MRCWIARPDHELFAIGATAILSDADIAFQRRKIQRSGLWDAVDGRVLVTLHKERRLDLVQRRFPAGHYVMIEDKPQLLAAMKQILGVRLTTVFVRQGHYAIESAGTAIEPAPDIGVENIGDLCELSLVDFHAATVTRAVANGRERTPEAHCQE